MKEKLKGNFLLKQFVRYVINSIPYRRFCFLYLDFILIFDQVQDYDFDYHHSSSLKSENFEISMPFGSEYAC